MNAILMKRPLLFSLLLAFTLCTAVWRPAVSEAKKIKVEVEVDEDNNNNTASKQKSAPATFPVTFTNKNDNKVSVALLYYDKNAKKWRCQGWWNVEPKKKRSIKIPHVEGKPIYYHVELSSNGQILSRTGTSKGANWTITRKKFSYLQGLRPKLDKPYKAHFVRGETDDGWWSLTIN